MGLHEEDTSGAMALFMMQSSGWVEGTMSPSLAEPLLLSKYHQNTPRTKLGSVGKVEE